MSFQVCWSDSIPCSHRDRRPPRTFPALSGASRPDSGPWTVSALPPYPFRSFKDFQRSFGERRVHHRIDEQILVDEAATHLPAALLFGQRILDFSFAHPLLAIPRRSFAETLRVGFIKTTQSLTTTSSSVPGLIPSLCTSAGIAALPPCPTVVVPLVSLHCV